MWSWLITGPKTSSTSHVMSANKTKLPSKEGTTLPSLGKREHHLQIYLGLGYATVDPPEGIHIVLLKACNYDGSMDKGPAWLACSIMTWSEANQRLSQYGCTTKKSPISYLYIYIYILYIHISKQTITKQYNCIMCNECYDDILEKTTRDNHPIVQSPKPCLARNLVYLPAAQHLKS